MCCGQKRSELSRAPERTAAPAARQNEHRPTVPSDNPVRAKPAPAQPSHGMVTLRYLEKSPVQVRGPVSGRQYVFSASSPIQAVDTRDAAGLLATRFFGRS